MSLNDKDYKKMANAIVTDYLNDKAGLHAGVVKVADNVGMNIHEAKRLIETTNTKAHLRIFEKKAGDKIVEFDTVDPADVRDELFTDCEDTVTKQASVERPVSRLNDFEAELPDEYVDTDKMDKVASLTTPDVVDEGLTPEQKGLQDFQRNQKTAAIEEELKDQMHFALEDYRQKIASYAERFEYIYGPDFKSFEKKARTLYGADADNPLHELSSYLDKSLTHEKTASKWVAPDEHLDEFEKLVGLHKEAMNRAKALKWFKERKDVD